MRLTTEELSKVTIGTKIILHYSTGLSISPVVRITKTMIILLNSSRISRKNGRQVGAEKWNSVRYEIATKEREEEVVIEIRRIHRARVLDRFDFTKLKTEQIDKIYNITRE